VLLLYYYKRHGPGYVATHSQLASEAMAVLLLDKKILAVRQFSASEMLNCTPRRLKMVMEHMNDTGLSVTIILLVSNNYPYIYSLSTLGAAITVYRSGIQLQVESCYSRK